MDINQLALGMQQLGGSGNYSQVFQFYTNSSRMTWIGNITSDGGAPFNSKGSGVGISDIKFYYSNGFASFVPTPTVQVSDLVAEPIGPSTVNVIFSLFVSDATRPWGDANATIMVQQQWVGSNGTWVIANDTWNFTSTWTQIPGLGEVGPGTHP